MSLEELINRVGIKALHCLDPETSHNATIKMLATGLAPAFTQKADPRLAYTLGDITFTNPVGMAAGFDKNAEVFGPLLRLGFGHVEVGTITPLPQEGNPRPRNFRLSADRAVINRYGFNNQGHEVVYERIKAATKPAGGVLGINIGANKLSEDRVADYVLGVNRFAELADYLTANISSPNTPGLRDLQQGEALAYLLKAIMEARNAQQDRLGRKVPVFLKIAPDVTEDELKEIVDTVLSNQVDGMVVSNTTIARPLLKDTKQAQEMGGLSGAPLFEKATIALAKTRKFAGKDLPLFGVGGVDTPEKAASKIMAGANQVQLYSGMVYEGQTLVKKINTHLSDLVTRYGVANLQELVGWETEEWAARPLD